MSFFELVARILVGIGVIAIAGGVTLWLYWGYTLFVKDEL